MQEEGEMCRQMEREREAGRESRQRKEEKRKRCTYVDFAANVFSALTPTMEEQKEEQKCVAKKKMVEVHSVSEVHHS